MLNNWSMGQSGSGQAINKVCLLHFPLGFRIVGSLMSNSLALLALMSLSWENLAP